MHGMANIKLSQTFGKTNSAVSLTALASLQYVEPIGTTDR